MAEMAMQNWSERLRLVFHTAEGGRAGYVKPVQLKGTTYLRKAPGELS